MILAIDPNQSTCGLILVNRVEWVDLIGFSTVVAVVDSGRDPFTSRGLCPLGNRRSRCRRRSDQRRGSLIVMSQPRVHRRAD
jgi:hypothetical protein